MGDKINLEVESDYEMSNSEDEYTAREKQLLNKVKKGRKRVESSDEEVMKFSDGEQSDFEDEDDSEVEKFVADSDLEDDRRGDGLPDSRDWGKKKHMYYNTDFHDNDYTSGYTEKEEELAMLEEQEALAIQKRIASELTEADFNLDAFKAPTDEVDDEKVKKIIKTDLSELTQKQKLALFKQDSPEFEGLVKDFSDRMGECKDLLMPAIELLKSLDFSEHPFIDFIKCRKDLILSYCTNISFYLMLKAKRVKIANHPVVKRLVQFRELICKLDDIFEYVIRPQLELILKEGASEEKSNKLKILEELKSKVEESIAQQQESESDNEEEQKTINKPLFNQQSDSEEAEEESDQEEKEVNVNQKDGKRQITRQIAKNKGLTATKRRELRNPRVKNRLKFKKAVKRRKGAVQPIRSKVELYGGEATGIKTHLKRSTKIK
jgi:U3 small nucleolar RNA-associated protein 3